MPTKVLFFFVLALGLSAVISVAAYVMYKTYMKDMQVKTKDIVENIQPEAPLSESSSLKDQTVIQYRKGKCLIINRFDCPSTWNPVVLRECEEKVEKCQDKYKSLQKFCNVYCEEELEKCQEDIQRAKELCFSDSLYLRTGYYF